jgi:hypothetical protein
MCVFGVGSGPCDLDGEFNSLPLTRILSTARVTL